MGVIGEVANFGKQEKHKACSSITGGLLLGFIEMLLGHIPKDLYVDRSCGYQ